MANYGDDGDCSVNTEHLPRSEHGESCLVPENEHSEAHRSAELIRMNDHLSATYSSLSLSLSSMFAFQLGLCTKRSTRASASCDSHLFFISLLFYSL